MLGARPSVVERFAAEELKAYIQRLTGREHRDENDAFEVLIGRPETLARIPASIAAASEDDRFVVRTVHENGHTALVLTGGQDRSCLFAVYRLLETFGVRFYGYRDRNGEVVPKLDRLPVPDLNITERPMMKYRFVSDNGFSAADKTKLTAIADWAAKNRCNTIMLTPSRAGETWDQIAIEEVKKRGLAIAGPGHILARLTPDRALFATHPEYFPLINGQRRDCYSAAWGGCTSLCVSNAEALRLTVVNAIRYLDANPCIDLFALFPPDGPQRGVQCQCPDCARLTTSDRYLTLINAVAAALASRPHAPRLMWIAYNECGMVPPQVRPLDQGRNMVLMWCNDLRDHGHAFDSETNRHAASYLANKPRLRIIKTDGFPHPGDEQLSAWERWQSWAGFLREHHAQGGVVLLEYYNAHVAHSLGIPWLGHCQSGPWPDGVIQRDFQTYAAQGIRGWQNCTDWYNDSPSPYWNWLAAQMQWNPDADAEALDRDFYQHFYGPAGDAMQAFFKEAWGAIVHGKPVPKVMLPSSADPGIAARLKLVADWQKRN